MCDGRAVQEANMVLDVRNQRAKVQELIEYGSFPQ